MALLHDSLGGQNRWTVKGFCVHFHEIQSRLRQEKRVPAAPTDFPSALSGASRRQNNLRSKSASNKQNLFKTF